MVLSSHSFARLAAILGVVVLVSLPVSFWSVVTIATLTHVAVALIYSRRQLSDAMSSVGRAAPAVVAIVMGLGLQKVGFPLLFFFGVHHVFTEVYLLQREIHGEHAEQTAGVRVWSVLFDLMLYLSVLHASPGNLPLPILFAGLAMTGVGYAVALADVRQTLTLRAIADTCAIEILSLAVLALSFRFRIDQTHYVMYHVLFWAVYPLPKIRKAGQMLPFAGWHAAVISALWICSPWGPLATSMDVWSRLFFTGTYVHISSSFAWSSAQPAWLNRLFRVRLHGAARSVALAPPALVPPSAVLDE